MRAPSPMKTDFLGLRTVIYRVPDLQRAKDWYAQVLGFQPYFDQPFYVGFNVGGYELGLIPNAENSLPGSNTGSVTPYWGVHDVQKAFDHLIAAGASAHENPQNVGGDIIVATALDPWGNPFGIIYNPEFKIQ